MSLGPQSTFAQRFWQNFRENMGANDSPAEKRQKALAVSILGGVMFLVGIGCTVSAWQDYRTLGSSPQELTTEEAVPSMAEVAGDARWVSITSPLIFDCENYLEHTVNGIVEDRRFFASDSAKERYFYVNLKKDMVCENLPHPLTGILKKADSGLAGWVEKKKMPVPVSKYPLMEFVVGAGPDSQRILLYTGIALMVIFGGITAVSIRTRQTA